MQGSISVLQASPLLMKKYTFEEIAMGKHQASPWNSYHSQSLEFCQNWLKGQKIFVQQSSGSTGTAKKIHIHRTHMEASAQATVQTLGLEAQDTALVCINTGYIGGKMMLVRAMLTGFHTYLNQ